MTSPRRARQKGLEFERLGAQLLRKVFPRVKRRLEFQQLEKRGVDLENTDFYCFQFKKLKNYAPINTIKEIEIDSLVGEIPVLVTSGTNMEPMAVLPFDALVRLLEIERALKKELAQKYGENK